MVAEARIDVPMTDYDEKNAGFPAKYRGLPALPPGREKAGLLEWEEKAIEGKHNEADALTKALPEPRFRELTALFRGRKPRMLRALMAGLRKLGWVRSEAGSWHKAHGEGPTG